MVVASDKTDTRADDERNVVRLFDTSIVDYSSRRRAALTRFWKADDECLGDGFDKSENERRCRDSCCVDGSG